MARIRVTHTYQDDGHAHTWTSDTGDTEANRKRRLRQAGTPFRHGAGWAEIDHTLDGAPYVERIDWLADDTAGGFDFALTALIEGDEQVRIPITPKQVDQMIVTGQDSLTSVTSVAAVIGEHAAHELADRGLYQLHFQGQAYDVQDDRA